MKPKTIICLFTLALFLGGGAATGLSAQNVDFAKLKKEEDERKKKEKESVYVVTNDNLDTVVKNPKPHSIIKLHDKPSLSPVSSDSPSPEANEDKTKNAESGKAADEKTKEFWQKKVEELLTKIYELEKTLPANISYAAELRGAIPVEHLLSRRAKMQEELTKLESEIKADETKLAELKTAYEDLSDEARKKSIPPGWLRVDEEAIREKVKNKTEGPVDKEKKEQGKP